MKKIEKKWTENETSKPKLFEEEKSPNVYLQVCLKKIPKMNSKSIKVFLPNPFIKEVTDVCLITGDLDKKNPRADPEETVRYYKNLLEQHQIDSVTEIISLRELFTEYKQYEARRKLCNAYDIFLTDRKIFSSVISALGKDAITRGKVPRKINIAAKNLKQEITNTLAYTVCCFRGRGSVCSICIGNISQSKDELVENILAVVDKFAAVIPGNWENIRRLHIKCSRSLAIPIYVSFGSSDEIKLPSFSIPNVPIEDELSTLPNGRVKVYPDGTVDIIKDKEVNKTKTGLKLKEKIKEKKKKTLKRLKKSKDISLKSKMHKNKENEKLPSKLSKKIRSKKSLDSSDKTKSTFMISNLLNQKELSQSINDNEIHSDKRITSRIKKTKQINKKKDCLKSKKKAKNSNIKKKTINHLKNCEDSVLKNKKKKTATLLKKRKTKSLTTELKK